MDDDKLLRAAEDAGIPLGPAHIDMGKLRTFAMIVGDTAIEEYCADQDIPGEDN